MVYLPQIDTEVIRDGYQVSLAAVLVAQVRGYRDISYMRIRVLPAILALGFTGNWVRGNGGDAGKGPHTIMLTSRA